MVTVIGPQMLNSFQVRGTYGFSGGYGIATWSLGRWGYYNPLAGIYKKQGRQAGGKFCRAKFYRTPNPQTPAQQAWRAKFATGISGYQALTADEKTALNKEARKYRQSGLTLYMRRYLHAVR